MKQPSAIRYFLEYLIIWGTAHEMLLSKTNKMENGKYSTIQSMRMEKNIFLLRMEDADG